MIGDGIIPYILICPICCLLFVHLYLFVHVCVFNSFVCIFAHFISCALLVLALALQDIIHSWLQISICIQICIFTPLCVCIFYLASTACIGIIIAKQGCRWEEGGVSIYHRSVEFRKKLRQKRRGGVANSGGKAKICTEQWWQITLIKSDRVGGEFSIY